MARNHRTALVIDVSQGTPGDFKERYKRLIESTGGSNIKVDLFHWDGTQLREGAPGQTSAPSASGLDAAVAKLGYEQVVISKPGKAGASQKNPYGSHLTR